jgi:hypothetical protein
MSRHISLLAVLVTFVALSLEATAQSDPIAVTIQPANPVGGDFLRAEIAIPACSVYLAPITQVVRNGASVDIYVATKSCDLGSTLPYNPSLGYFEEGRYRLTLYVNSSPRTALDFTVGPKPPTPPIAVDIEPTNPNEDDPVIARIGLSQCFAYVDKISRPEPFVLIVDLVPLACPGLPAAPVRASLGRLSAGTYRASVRFGVGDEERGSVTFTVAKGPPKLNYTDLWWTATESGTGLSITQHPNDQVFVVWYAYGTDGRPLWFAMPGVKWGGSKTFKGSFYRVSGPSPTAFFDPSKVTQVIAGEGEFVFDSAGSADFWYLVNGVSGHKRITRQPF